MVSDSNGEILKLDPIRKSLHQLKTANYMVSLFGREQLACGMVFLSLIIWTCSFIYPN